MFFVSCAWGAFTKHRQFLVDRRASPRLKKRVFVACVMPCFLYGCESWSLKLEEKRKLDVAQKKMERAMLGISRIDRIRNDVVAERTRLPRVTEVAWKRKVEWAWKVANTDTENGQGR